MRKQNRPALPTLCLFVIIALCASVFIPRPTDAHSPGALTLKYDAETRILYVTVSHGVSNPSKHYIEKVTITKNGAYYKAVEYTRQPDESPFTYEYIVDATTGDELKVKAECSYFGSKTRKIDVGKEQ